MVKKCNKFYILFIKEIATAELLKNQIGSAFAWKVVLFFYFWAFLSLKIPGKETTVNHPNVQREATRTLLFVEGIWVSAPPISIQRLYYFASNSTWLKYFSVQCQSTFLITLNLRWNKTHDWICHPWNTKYRPCCPSLVIKEE